MDQQEPVQTDEQLWPVLGTLEREDLEPLIQLLRKKSIYWRPDESLSIESLRRSVHDELLVNGGHTLRNLIRGGGPPWAEVVDNAATHLRISIEATDTTESIERKVAFKLLEQAIDGMTPQQIKELRKHLEERGIPGDLPLGGGALAAALAAGELGGFATYELLTTIANGAARVVLGQGLSLATNASLMRGLSLLLGPAGWALSALLTVTTIGGPAYRVTVRSVALIAILRARQRALTTDEPKFLLGGGAPEPPASEQG